ncbi:unnamed protein product [Prunus armeniaca]|uniref:Encoded peptide n=1 Tax=Prunus armeniaca TaxID=36596 RepID=A0A6J5VEV7_PRUAR|nr:hypothetical protein GBA52_023566 [Prunus armeniaca]CAB4287446.1 unnamed protein product [Prunus armeniaca]CAB4317822.1 unnamed protein product [Prunus armeniaca]
MALNKLTFISYSLLSLLIILTWEIQSIDARPLNSKSKNELRNFQTHTKTHQNKLENNVGHINDFHGKSTTEASAIVVASLPPPQGGQVGGAAQPRHPTHGVDDFRPTAPGHSPGVGHSIQN